MLPISREPIEDGAVGVVGNKIVAVGSWKDLGQRYGDWGVTDLGETMLLPGLINAHCHLDYTDMAGLVPPGRFTDWVKGLLAYKAGWSYTDFAASWLNGARMLVRSGTTTVADIEAVPELLPDVWETTPLRVCSFLELTCVKNQARSEEIVQEAIERMHQLQAPRGFMGLSPHALYSTVPSFLEKIAEEARKENWRLTMHVAESPEEFEMYVSSTGAMFEWLAKQRDMSDCCRTTTPTRQVQRCGLLNDRLLVVHANYLRVSDIKLLSSAKASVVHCPRSHSFFDYERFPYQKLASAGVNVCMGTDSLASVHRLYGHKPELSLFAEMGVFAAKNPRVGPEAIVRMATINGARALGLEGQVGELKPGANADMIVLPFTGRKSDAYATVVGNWRDVAGSMIDGKWVL